MECKNQNESLQVDLKLAFKRISDLQVIFENQALKIKIWNTLKYIVFYSE